jgi:hypothetical protein
MNCWQNSDSNNHDPHLATSERESLSFLVSGFMLPGHNSINVKREISNVKCLKEI